MNRFLGLLLTVALLVSSIPVALAEDTGASIVPEPIEAMVEEVIVELRDETEEMVSEDALPEDALTVQGDEALLAAVIDNETILSDVVLPAELTRIEEAAFEGDAAITTMIIPKHVEQIGSRAFADCIELREVFFGNNANLEIARDAFAGCDAVSFYVFPNTPAELYALSHGFDCGLMEPGSGFLEKALAIVEATGGTENVLQSSDFSSKRLIVRTAGPNLPDISACNPVKIARDGANTFFVQFDSVGDAIDCYYTLEDNGDVIFVDADANLEILDDTSAAGYVSTHAWDTDDPMGFDAYSAYVSKYDSAPVKIAIIDTGVSERPAYSARLLNGINLVPDGQSWSYDPTGHGSAIASVIADCVGEANVSILPIRVVGSNGIASLTLIGAGIKAALEQGVDIINLSMSFEENSYVTHWIDTAISRGVQVVVAAGNSSRDIRKVYPANVPGVIAVSGIDSSYALSAGSNYGENIAYCAPDTDIEILSYPGSFSGTSFAAPMVAAMLALVKQDPYHNLEDVNTACRDLGAEGRDSAYGHGLPQLDRIAKVHVDNIRLNSNLPEQMAIGDSCMMNWTIEPSYATDKRVSLTSDNAGVVKVEASGSGAKLTAVGQGSATVTVSALNVREGTQVSVSAFIVSVQPVTGITIAGESDKLYMNRQMFLSAAVAPSDATNPRFIWRTTNSQIAMISDDGVLTPVAEGTVGVYAVAQDGYGAQSAVVSVEVLNVPDADSIIISEASGIDISTSPVELTPGRTLDLTATVLPEQALQDVVWSCSSVPAGAMTISADGRLTASKAGEAVVTATAANGVQQTLNLVCIVRPVSIAVSGTATTFDVGGTASMRVTFAPPETTDTAVTWSSTRPEVATVDQNGVVTGVSGGTASIIATSKNNAKVTGALSVTIRQPYRLSFNANGGSVTPNARTAYCDYAVGSLPTPTRDYHSFEGWFTEASGGTRVTENSVFSVKAGTTIYAHWKEKPLSDWVLASQLPSGAAVINRKTETTESTQSSINGWTVADWYWRQTGHASIQYASKPEGVRGHWPDTNFENGPLQPYENATHKRDVVNAWAGYVYWHWMYDTNFARGWEYRAIYNNGRDDPSYLIAPATGYGYRYFGAFTDTTDYEYGGTGYTNNLRLPNYIVRHKTDWTECQGATRWFRYDYYTSTYTDYEKVYRFKRELVQYRNK